MPRDNPAEAAERQPRKASLQIAKLRLIGFKSFVDLSELAIEPGLTGIVGPNGCGKSNVVEALRWVMGETSARQMRGGEMDDVIFGGTSARPARDMAEVAMELDNGTGAAPHPFGGCATIEISRRIERAQGSTYRINGKGVRARDIQLLLADSSTGARSTAFISQGQVGSLIAAKPAERRVLLEEAAGITGLHSRRHEAELRLRAAEANLERLEDIVATLEVQRHHLNKQARQVARYRTLSEQIRETEALLYALRWRAACRLRDEAQQMLAAAAQAVEAATAGAEAAGERQSRAAAVLPALRRSEAETATELQRLTAARDGLDAEERRINGETSAARLRLDQAMADLQRERSLMGDADAALSQLSTEARRIEAARRDEDRTQAGAVAALEEVGRRVGILDAALAEATAELASVETGRAALTRSRTEIKGRRDRLFKRVADMDLQQAALARQRQALPDPAAGEAALEAAARAVEDCERAAAAADERQAAAAAARSDAQAARHAAVAEHVRWRAEEEALSAVLSPEGPSAGPPILDHVTAPPGLEGAVAAALGDDLMAPLETLEEGVGCARHRDNNAGGRAAVYWRALEPLTSHASFPPGVETLGAVIGAPAALTRRLSQVGLVAEAGEGFRHQAALRPGQRLVTRDGAQWRWDGFTATAAASSTAARLRQRNRLEEVKQRRIEAEHALGVVAQRADAAQRNADEAAAAERETRAALRAAQVGHVRVREGHLDARARLDRLATRENALQDARQSVEIERAECEAALAACEMELSTQDDPAEARERLQRLGRELAALRTEQADRRAAADALAREAEGRRRRLGAIAREQTSWRARRDGAEEQLALLEDRRRRAAEELDALSALPAALARRRGALLEAIAAKAGAREDATDRLTSAEAAARSAEQALRAAEAALVTAREKRVRAEAALEQSEAGRRSLLERIASCGSVKPEGLEDLAAAAPVASSDPCALEVRLDRMRRDRDVMGPVNLRAEQEAIELSERIRGLTAERTDLLAAIAKLRQGVTELNHEGRERLMASFAHVDRHFRDLFVRLFGGGRAHLTLTDSDDPLDAGIEIMASPPGKRLQSLSLMSGGEQALATLALVFAVFSSTPAPICVLDEVDAPLDDANVDRLCSLLADLTASTGTRFMVVTHHRMTMARMDRLYGVTMVERGVSQLVSVDLRRAEQLRDST